MVRTDRRWRLLGTLVLLLWASAAQAAQAFYPVQRVVDGDTVVLETIGTVRLIGVDTPETVDPRKPVQAFGAEASQFLHSLLDGQRVRLEFDQQRTDKYGRTLAYLYLPDDTFVNREIVAQGYGHAYLNYPFHWMEEFREVERHAREAGLGLWAEPPMAQAAPASSLGRVWVNSSSHVYHCPGTRYYGTTARGTYMSEADARTAGNRPAYGRACGSLSVESAEPPKTPAVLPAVAAPPGSAVKVWVNTSSRVYHCPGARYYGTTAHGNYMGESEAVSSGFRPAGGKACGPTASASTSTATSAAEPGKAAAPPSGSQTQVWVNTSSHVYHCPGTRYYGNTKSGNYMAEQAAVSAGNRPAGGRSCS